MAADIKFLSHFFLFSCHGFFFLASKMFKLQRTAQRLFARHESRQNRAEDKSPSVSDGDVRCHPLSCISGRCQSKSREPGADFSVCTQLTCINTRPDLCRDAVHLLACVSTASALYNNMGRMSLNVSWINWWAQVWEPSWTAAIVIVIVKLIVTYMISDHSHLLQDLFPASLASWLSLPLKQLLEF